MIIFCKLPRDEVKLNKELMPFGPRVKELGFLRTRLIGLSLVNGKNMHSGALLPYIDGSTWMDSDYSGSSLASRY